LSSVYFITTITTTNAWHRQPDRHRQPTGKKENINTTRERAQRVGPKTHNRKNTTKDTQPPEESEEWKRKIDPKTRCMAESARKEGKQEHNTTNEHNGQQTHNSNNKNPSGTEPATKKVRK
jgi:hypothetical protein